MYRLSQLARTSVGSKVLVALSGLLLIGFLLGHMLGNMTLLQGPEVMNSYAHWLKGHPLLWVARIGLAVLFVTHIVVALMLAAANRRARPTRYHVRGAVRAGRTSRYIVLTGVLVLTFLIYHLLHFTLGVVQPAIASLVDSEGRPDVYHVRVKALVKVEPVAQERVRGKSAGAIAHPAQPLGQGHDLLVHDREVRPNAVRHGIARRE